ncbi:RHS repeat-associated core domain-containing protein [Prevotella sp. tc2-28]|uniref:DUF6443 domain-containing protein n=1 Tax=Prevotella sp. tc2-28 TaxID=1761888 RepID=UPI00089A905C|nr:RHS repeat-associated core domain-containing protein [Prevotella sp. tc2-28]SEA74912.1 RHS repeat-associated core domain-containing protein [Prevotella sp. tc2-28]
MNMNIHYRLSYLLLTLLSVSIHAQDANWSYVKTRTMTNAVGTAYLDRISYDNGLGQVYQDVQAGITPSHKNLVTLHEYDAFRRPEYVWLPGISESASCQTVSVLKTSSRSVNADNDPYTRHTYEPSPLDFATKEELPGTAWRQQSKSVRHYLNSNQTSGDYGVKHTLGLVPPGSACFVNATYNANAMLVNEMVDEDGLRHLSFVNKDGQIIAERRIKGTERLTTNYAYDHAGNLVMVLPPALSDMVEGNYYLAPSDEEVKQYGYEYRYDGLHHCIYKRLPGCEPVYYIYDKAGRLILSQDGVQRSNSSNLWSFSIPDAFGRTVLTGECSYSGNYSTEPLFNTVVKATRTTTGGTYGYTVSGIQLSNAVVHTVSYYDDYSFIGTNNIPSALSYATPPDNDCGTQGLASPKGLLTGSVTARLTPAGVVGYNYSALYYDDRGRVIQTRSTNHLGGYDCVYTGYDFTDHVVKECHTHQGNNNTVTTETVTSTYDHAGRLLTKTHRLNNGSVITLQANQYDELGRLEHCTRNGSNTLKTDYTYNVRSWMTSIDSPLFKEYLYYHTSHNGSTAQYGGNISAMDWQTGSLLRGYTFQYDSFSRLTQASYKEGGNASTKYGTAYSYDRMGNMLTMERSGRQDNGNYGLIDDVTFTYDGNQIDKADDDSTDPTYAGAFHFRDGADEDTEYEYDENGNMTKDLNKNISSIQYNSLNLPTSITYSDGRSAAYIYGAGGKKLRVSYKTSPVSTEVPTDYCGNVIYENNVLKQILVDGGYVTFSGSTPVYHFYLKDHLGNNRIVASASGTAEQVNHYYPFGGLMGESTNGDTQRFKYNGKELDRMHGLDWYDYGARHYDAARGSFTSIDPLAEKDYNISPYTYCTNNPINAFDPDGRNPFIGFVVGAGVDYAAQVIGNIASGNTSFTEAFTHDIDMGSIAASGMVGAVSGGASSLKTITTTAKTFSTMIKVGTDKKGNLDVHVRGGKELVTNATGNLVGKGANRMLNKIPSPKISYVTKNQVKAQLRAEGVKNGGINSKARSVAAQKNLRADKVNKQVEASLKKTNELTSKSFENYIVKEKDNGN